MRVHLVNLLDNNKIVLLYKGGEAQKTSHPYFRF